MGTHCYYILVLFSCFLFTVYGLPVYGNQGGYPGAVQEVFRSPRGKTQSSLNDALSMDSDEDLFFDQLWLEEDEDEDTYDFIYNFFDDDDEDPEPSIMLVSSSSDDHLIELAMMARAKDTLVVVTSVEQDDDDLYDLDMTSET